ncbi:multidrug ABC transporter ATP-binding protein [Jeotgalicoccus coquinae]|uniref:ABC-2 type transport system ATP-binding protein n=1 Tax=Jeotgalicoccus coquinae TaxID=709509 RepID=A0A6V7R402_9STAP|nr:ATP-binding cassette domain-containing protein [Jeotgalicoccus coquinae]MBB6423477.1 ABC-2 type transport system ATP-binding protein [Jeotgalicoccus coquinae]GGE20144.1 multidrug ABC transporter ATP-binding protein [Jeotgalicoccus coquinae]CAD2071642.1 ABC-type transporter ATP-binding protein EcsA [Jeotgalicoccus coquinae]
MSLTVRNLTINYGTNTVLKEVNFNIPDNTIIGLVAPNGTGKTTLFNAIIRFIPINSGEILIDDKVYKNTTGDVKALHSKITFFPDQAELYEDFSGVEHIEMYRDIWNPGSSNIDAVISRLNMKDYVKNKVKTYSLGMRQRLCFAMMIAADTKIMFMDEIMNGLDPVNVELVSSVLQEIKEDGKIIIVASHLLENLDDYADQIYFLNEQSIYYTYDREESHREYVKGYISEDKLKHLDLKAGTLYLDGDRICIPADNMSEKEVFETMCTLKQYSRAEVSLGALGTHEHYLRIYKGERSYETV